MFKHQESIAEVVLIQIVIPLDCYYNMVQEEAIPLPTTQVESAFFCLRNSQQFLDILLDAKRGCRGGIAINNFTLFVN